MEKDLLAGLIKEEYSALPKSILLPCAIILLLFGGAYELGQALSTRILNSQNTQIELRSDPGKIRVGSLIDLNESGVVFLSRGANSFPVFIPLEEVARIEFGFSM